MTTHWLVSGCPWSLSLATPAVSYGLSSNGRRRRLDGETHRDLNGQARRTSVWLVGDRRLCAATVFPVSLLNRIRGLFAGEPSQPCPACGSDAVAAVTVPGAGGPFESALEPDGPAWGCTRCHHKWGRWGDEHADGRV